MDTGLALISLSEAVGTGLALISLSDRSRDTGLALISLSDRGSGHRASSDISVRQGQWAQG